MLFRTLRFFWGVGVDFADVLLLFFFSSFSPIADFLPPSFPTMSSYERVSAQLVTLTEICWRKAEEKTHGCVSGTSKSGEMNVYLPRRHTLYAHKLRHCVFPRHHSSHKRDARSSGASGDRH